MRLQDYVGKYVRIFGTSGIVKEGQVISYTPAYDNDPEVECIDVRVPGSCMIIEYEPDEIASIEIIDK